MTAPEPAPTPEPEKRPATITIRRSTAIIAAAIAAALIVGSIGVTGWALWSVLRAADSEAAAPAATATRAPETTAAKETPSPTPEPSTPEPSTPGLGTPITVGPVTFAVNSFEVVQQIDVVQGEPLVPDPGGELVLFHTTYSNSQNPADLSCGGNDLYIQVFDEQGREMAQIFETYRIPGNPECNHQLLQTTTAEWNWAVQGVAGATPTTMVVTETLTWSSPVEIALQ